MPHHKDEGSIWTSIQHLKEKLQIDRVQLHNIKAQLNRSKSPFRRREPSNKENQSYISNCSNMYRKSIGQTRLPEQELKRIHRKQLTQTIGIYEDKIKKQQQDYQLELSRLKQWYQQILNEKNAYIQLLESSIQEQESGPVTPRLNQVHEVQEHYQRILTDVKTKYQTIIESISEENCDLKQQFKNLTFKNPHQLADYARQTVTKYTELEEVSRAEFSTSHIDYGSNGSSNRIRESVIDGSQRLSLLFRDKFKFRRGDQMSQYASVASLQDATFSSGASIWRDGEVNLEMPLPVVRERPFRQFLSQQNS